MTTQESFKKRVRARMQRTGEKYVEARRVLLAQADQRTATRDAVGGRTWVAEPDHAEEVVRDATGRGWDDWVDLVEAGPAAAEGHTAVAAWLQEEHGVAGWWAQAVTVGWERITGRRLPHQMADGTFTAGRSRTVDVDADALRELLLEEDGRRVLFPAHETELRSRATSRAVRIAIGGGVALVDLASLDDGRTRVTVAHEKLPTVGDVALWKDFWGDWLEALER